MFRAALAGFRLSSRRGDFFLTGVDYSEEFLSEARSNAVKKKLTIVYQHREMRDLPWPAQFDGAFCFGNSFGYLDDEGIF